MPAGQSPANPAMVPIAAHAPSPEVVARTLARHPRPLGGDTARSLPSPVVSLTALVLNNQRSEVSGQKSEVGGQRSGGAGSLEESSTVNRQSSIIRKKPAWLRAKVPGGPEYERLKRIVDEHRLHTVCQEASCPNLGECWSRGTATIMILGDVCTRSCGFCNVKTGRPLPVDLDEPRRVAESLALMNLRHVVITCVDRDDLDDGGAAIWAETIRRVHEACPRMTVEVLTGDFKGDRAAIQTVIEAKPEIFAHNFETVLRMHPAVRPQARYERTMSVLMQAKEAGMTTKTGIMVGIGERDDEVLALMDDIRTRAQTDIFTIGQYLQPTRNHLPLDRWVTPGQFAEFKREGLARGFRVVESGPLVRSSYHAEEQAERLS